MLGEKIRNLRKENNISQEELAEKLNVSRQSVSLWENGQTQPSIENIIAIAKIFGVTTDILLKENIEAVSSKISIQNPKRKLKVWEIVLLALGSPLWISLLIAFFAVVLSVYVSLWAVFVSLVACGFSGVIAGFIVGMGNNWYTGFAMIAVALACLGFSIFFFFGCKAATNGFILLTKKLKKGEAK